jgi:hypothetical protein
MIQKCGYKYVQEPCYVEVDETIKELSSEEFFSFTAAWVVESRENMDDMPE